MAVQNYASQSSTFGGSLTFPATTALALAVTIPLFIRELDIPIRQPKITEINTIPTLDEYQASDGVTSAVFYGASDNLTTAMSGYLLTPTTTVIDPAGGGRYQQLNPTNTGVAGGTLLGLAGFSYGDLIWAYLEGKINPVGTHAYRRVDPSSYTDPYGNTYLSPVITVFTSTQQVAMNMVNFTMTLGLET